MPRAITKHTKDADAWNRLAVALKRAGKFEDSVQAAQRAIELRPGFTEAYANLGNALKERGAYEDAILACRGLEVTTGIGCGPIQYRRRSSGRWKGRRAVATFKELVSAFHPGFAPGYNNLGRAGIAGAVRRKPKALTDMRSRMPPLSAGMLTNLGNVLVAMGRVDEGIEAHRKAVDIDPQYPDTRWNLGCKSIF